MSGEPFTGTLNYWVLQTVAMLLTALLIPGLRITGLFGATLTVVALALVNATLWDAALFFQVPDAPTTQALVLLATNGAIFWLLVKLLPGIAVSGVLPALAAPIVFTLVSLLISEHGRSIDWLTVIDRAIALLEQLRGYVEFLLPSAAPVGESVQPPPTVPAP